MTTMLPPRTPVEGGPPMDEYGRITIEPGAMLTRAMACAGNAWARESMFAEGEWSAAHLRA